MEIKVSVEIDTPPEVVWGVLTDFERWPDWTASVTAVERVDRSAFGVGSRVRIRQPRLKALVWRVSEFQEGRLFTWEARSVGIFIIGRHSTLFRVFHARCRCRSQVRVFARDLWPVVEHPPGALHVHLIVGDRSQAYSTADRERAERIAASSERVTLDVLPAGHWVHVDDPDGLLTTLLAHVGR